MTSENYVPPPHVCPDPATLNGMQIWQHDQLYHRPPAYPNILTETNMGKHAAREFMTGFFGCLGVGLAIVVVIVFGLVMVASCAGHG